MDYTKLDNEELLRLAIDAINTQRQADGLVLLKTVLERDPTNTGAIYMLAGQHAQLGLMDRAEAGFRQVLQADPSLATARFQYGQLLLSQERKTEAVEVLAPLLERQDELGAYARALHAAAQDRAADTVRELAHGLAQPQTNAALAIDMRRLRDQLAETSPPVTAEAVPQMETTAPIFLTGYGRAN